MLTYFNDDLIKFKEKLLTMGSYAERAVSQAVQSVVERDDGLASQVQQDDDLMDQLEVEIDDQAISLLAKAPLA
jgi:phosphate transport system protein